MPYNAAICARNVRALLSSGRNIAVPHSGISLTESTQVEDLWYFEDNTVTRECFIHYKVVGRFVIQLKRTSNSYKLMGIYKVDTPTLGEEVLTSATNLYNSSVPATYTQYRIDE